MISIRMNELVRKESPSKRAALTSAHSRAWWCLSERMSPYQLRMEDRWRRILLDVLKETCEEGS